MPRGTSPTLRLLRTYESRNVTFIDPDGSWPIVWERASGVHVWDENGNRHLDLTAAFGVAATGHANPRVIQAARRQMSRLVHAMGDVHPHRAKAELAAKLSELTFERWTAAGSARSARIKGKTIFCNSGFEAVEAALKTARLATSQSGIIAFRNAYHGLGYGALNATYREHFRGPFRDQLREFASFVSYPSHRSMCPGQEGKGILYSSDQPSVEALETLLRQKLRRRRIGAILVEPIQARGGINVPPDAFLAMLRRVADENDALLILDEIYTGFGRAGTWFACEHSNVIPDIICLGKALTGGFPLSACVGKAAVMDAAWPVSNGEAIHTSTFLGHPVGCAMALENIREIQRLNLVDRSAALGELLLEDLCAMASQSRGSNVKCYVRGRGLLAGIEILRGNKPATAFALDIIKNMLKRGFILLPEGEHSNVISFTPPLTIQKNQLRSAVSALESAMLKTLRI
ncbi:MAG TPA: aspartate aminotransferase family protein [Verrucomicrobiae bacterium]|nr:aspartate aminotransferase family protein [Verrucomicrobiae bacterium]